MLLRYHKYSRLNANTVMPHTKNILQLWINIGVRESHINNGIKTIAVASSTLRYSFLIDKMTFNISLFESSHRLIALMER